MTPTPTDPFTSLIEIHTDGACIGNPGPGGCAAILRRVSPTGETLKVSRLKRHDPDTTSNQMELQAVLLALGRLGIAESAPVTVISDSRYLVDGRTKYLENCRRNGWWSAEGKPVKNRDLWEAIDEGSRHLSIQWTWIKAHAGDPLNEEVDRLARAASGPLERGAEVRPTTVVPPFNARRSDPGLRPTPSLRHR